MATVADRVMGLRLSHPTRVAIDGRTAAGKTTFADELAAEVATRGRDVVRTSVDGFHRPRAERYRRGRMSPEGYPDDARDWQAVRRLLLDPLGPSGDRRYRTSCFDLATDTTVDPAVELASPDTILIVDGTFLQRAEPAGAWDLAVFMACTEQSALQRGVYRDAGALGGQVAAQDVHRLRYQAAFDMYERRVRPAQAADLVVDNDLPEALRLVRA